MGMFDTFYGEVKCPYCNEIHEFEVQTKSYDCTMSSLLLGDYIDKGNANYIYDFNSYCENTNQKFRIGIAIRRGQIVKYLVEDEIESTDIMDLENIEDGIGKRLQYEKVCREANGYPKEELNYELNPLINGYKFIAFGVEWEVVKLYRQNKTFLSRDIEYFYEIKSKKHGLRIMRLTKSVWNSIEIVTLELANKYRELYFDEENKKEY